MQILLKKLKKRKILTIYFFFCLMCILTFICVAPITANATDVDVNHAGTNNGTTAEDFNSISLDLGGGLDLTLSNQDGSTSLSATLQMLLLLTVISLAPSILIMVTSFTRILIVLHFTRSAVGTQTTPPNQILIGLSLILTFFIMSPTLVRINNEAIKPLNAGEVSQSEALNHAMIPIKDFMVEQLALSDNPKDLELFISIAGLNTEDYEAVSEFPIYVILPAFIINELRTAFIIGFFIYIPFIVIDMVVASTLMSMGMMMLPPTTISMPFKILLFIMADGWNRIIKTVVETFYKI